MADIDRYMIECCHHLPVSGAAVLHADDVAGDNGATDSYAFDASHEDEGSGCWHDADQASCCGDGQAAQGECEETAGPGSIRSSK